MILISRVSSSVSEVLSSTTFWNLTGNTLFDFLLKMLDYTGFNIDF